ncbi:MAG: ectoine hydrolase DoeA [Paracoccaceae bacterium]|nr:MAG: ectoine hydrolase DoeA [Paracoccaceae bacterium]
MAGGRDLPFSAGEYARRLGLVRAAMADAGIEALFVEDPSNMAWITGYDGWSFYVHQGVIVTQDGDPLWWGRGMDAAGALRTVWMAAERVHGYADDLVQAVDRHPMQDLAGLLRATSARRIGVEMDGYWFSARAYLTLCQALPGAVFVDATGLVNRLRAVKSAEEIAFMRRAARISEALIDGVAARVRPGLPKNELVAEIMRDAIRGVPGAWGDYAAIVPMLPSGSDAAAPHLTWDGRPFRAGEATFLELSGCYRRYHAPLCRTVMLGRPPDHLRRAEAAVIEAIEAAIDAARPGRRAADVARAVAGALARHGIRRNARCGYGVGLSYPPDWGECSISLRESDAAELRPGMTFHLMPGLWMEDWGLEITETILIRESGAAECLCDRPRGLIVKD